MDINTQIIITVAASSLTFAIGYFFANKKAKDDLEEITKNLNETNIKNTDLTSKFEATTEQLKSITTEKDNLKALCNDLQKENKDHAIELATLRNSSEEREKHHKEKLTFIENQKQELSERFKNLANDILNAKTKSLQDNNKTNIDAIIKPFKTSIDDFKKELKDNHNLGIKQHASLTNELNSLKGTTQKMTREAHDLATALKGQKKHQGNWGELMLENILEKSGLILDTDYKREVSFNAEDGKKRPDAIVYLPQEKHLIIDAKVSLNAYIKYVNSEDEIERKQALKGHIDAMKARIKELSAKDYYKIEDVNSPEIVFMFVPNESAFVAAINADATLFQTAIDQKVLVATPTTLLTSLNIVKQLWRYENQNKHITTLANKAEGVFNKLRTFLESFTKIDKSLGDAQNAYNAAKSQLVDGRGNLIKQVNDFKDLAPKITKELPSDLVEKANLELETTN